MSVDESKARKRLNVEKCENEVKVDEEKSDLTGDYHNVAILLFLYILQG
jgi:hypothetical protein